MKRPTILLTLFFVMIAKGMQPANHEVEVIFNDHLLTPLGYIRPLYDPIKKQIGVFALEANFNILNGQTIDISAPLLNAAHISVAFKLSHICGILQHNELSYIAAIGSLRTKNDSFLIAKHNFVTNAAKYQWTHLEMGPILTVDSLLFSNDTIRAKITGIDRDNKLAIIQATLNRAALFGE